MVTAIEHVRAAEAAPREHAGKESAATQASPSSASSSLAPSTKTALMKRGSNESLSSSKGGAITALVYLLMIQALQNSYDEWHLTRQADIEAQKRNLKVSLDGAKALAKNAYLHAAGAAIELTGGAMACAFAASSTTQNMASRAFDRLPNFAQGAINSLNDLPRGTPQEITAWGERMSSALQDMIMKPSKSGIDALVANNQAQKSFHDIESRSEEYYSQNAKRDEARLDKQIAEIQRMAAEVTRLSREGVPR